MDRRAEGASAKLGHS